MYTGAVGTGKLETAESRPDVEQTQLGDVRPTERLMREVGVIP